MVDDAMAQKRPILHQALHGQSSGSLSGRGPVGDYQPNRQKPESG